MCDCISQLNKTAIEQGFTNASIPCSLYIGADNKAIAITSSKVTYDKVSKSGRVTKATLKIVHDYCPWCGKPYCRTQQNGQAQEEETNV